jgi:hypothetical protein
VSHTHCSQFVAAAALMLGIPLLCPAPKQKLLANAQFRWLDAGPGRSEGWARLRDGAAAQAAANQGQFVLASLHNPDSSKPGHIAIVRPGTKDAVLLAVEGPDVMQAGRVNAMRTPLRVGFKSHGRRHYHLIAFFAHAVSTV